MDNIIDYCLEYGKYTLDEKPFNEVDSLVLSQFSYLKFDGILKPRGRGVRIYTIEQLSKSSDYENLFQDERYAKPNRMLMEAMASSNRFKNIRLHDYVNIVDEELEIQFSAITCIFDNGFVYIAFRGTDDSLIGWKEDFNMAFMSPVPSQEKAVAYLNQVASRTRGNLTIGGHSKGGNLAIYAAMFCKSGIQKRITEIYSHDGPGFVQDIIDEKRFELICAKIKKTVPRSSIVGMVLYSREKYEVVCCHNIGIGQHDPYNWILDDNGFKRADHVHRRNVIGNDSVNRWLMEMSYEERESFVEILYDIVSGSGADNLNDFKGEWKTRVAGSLDVINALSDDNREMMLNILKKLSYEVNETAKDYISEQIEEGKVRYKKKAEEGVRRVSDRVEHVLKAIEDIHKS